MDKNLDTIRKHFQEMILIQRDHVDAIDALEMNYNSTSDNDIDGQELRKNFWIKWSKKITALKKDLRK